MRQEKLSELLDISIGRTPSRNEPAYWGNGHPWVSIRDLSAKTVTETKEQITDLAVQEARCKIVRKGTLLFSFKLTIGKMAFAGCDLFTNEAIAAFHIKDERKLNSEFLYYALKSATFGGSNQAVMGKTLNSKSLAEIKIPLPPIDDQIRIAHLLGKVEGLIAQRKQHLQQLDDLLKSAFLEMFGPNCPDYDVWPLVEIRDLAAKHKGAMRTGPFGSNLLHSEFTDEGDVAVLGIDNAVQNRFAWGERRFISNEKYQELESYRIYPGDVIVTIMGTIGRSAVIPDDIPLAINTKHLAAITLNREVANPLFLSYSIHSSPFVLNQFRSKNRGAIMSGLNLGIIKETKLKRPPIELQNKFAETHTRVDKLKTMYQQSLTDLEALYGTLSQQAFKGELDLSRVPMRNTAPNLFPLDTPIDMGSPTSVASKVELSDINMLRDAAQGPMRRQDFLKRWLDEYRDQLGDASFTHKEFTALIETRLENWYVDDGFKIGIEDYEHIKTWVFEALASDKLTQVFDDERNSVQLKAAQA
jgi:type I restriction enzyme S subunit